MDFKYLIFFVFFSALTVNSKAQEAKARFVFFKEKDLVETLKEIMDKDDFCKNGFWIVQITKSNGIVISKGKNYLKKKEESEVAKNKRQYATNISNNLVFIFTEKRFDHFFKKTEFKMDLKPLLNIEFALFQDYSYWQIVKKAESYNVVKKFIHKCK